MVPLAERAAQAAVRIDGEDAWAHHALGSVHLLLRRHDDALAAQELALHLNPSFAFAQNFHVAALTFAGRCREGVGAANRAMRLNPRGTLVSLNYGAGAFAHYLCGNYAEAVQMSQAAIRLRTDFASAYRVLVAAAGMAGEKEIAAVATRELRRLHPNISRGWVTTHVPFKLDSDRTHYLEGFTRAGLE